MNERIRELVRESHLDVYGLGKITHKWEYTVERFAELIVKECLTIVDDLVDKQADGSWTSNELYTDYNGALHLADQQIRQHFGVEDGNV
jgi:hypothetical protein